jgi:hypothetical protein
MRRNLEQMPQLLRGTNSSFRRWRLGSLFLFWFWIWFLPYITNPLTHWIQGDTLTPHLIKIIFNIMLPSSMSLCNDFLLTDFQLKFCAHFSYPTRKYSSFNNPETCFSPHCSTLSFCLSCSHTLQKSSPRAKTQLSKPYKRKIHKYFLMF